SLDTTFDANSDVLLAIQNHGGALLAGGMAESSANIRVPEGISGDYHVVVRTDPNGLTGDVDLSNNIAVSAGTVHFVSIVSPPSPNLSISSVAVTGTDITGASVANAGVAGQPLHVDWTARNAGPGDIQGQSWSVACYLSQD